MNQYLSLFAFTASFTQIDPAMLRRVRVQSTLTSNTEMDIPTVPVTSNFYRMVYDMDVTYDTSGEVDQNQLSDWRFIGGEASASGPLAGIGALSSTSYVRGDTADGLVESLVTALDKNN